MSRLSIGVSLGLLLVAPAVARRPAAPAGQRPAVKVTTRLVQVNVVAMTKKGQPVEDLKRDDFILFDEGKQQKIAFFSAVPARILRPASPMTVPLNTFTNQPEQFGGAPSAVTVILFDGLNTRMTDQTYARQQITKFLNQIQPGDKVALYALGRGLTVLQDFTDNPRSLATALKNYHGSLSAESEAALRRPADAGLMQFHQWLDELRLNLVDHYAKDRALRTIRSLVAIANHLERIPGRKNLIWVSGSFPVWIGRDSAPLPEQPPAGRQFFWPEVERAARALNNSNLAIYPVDARGLMAPVAYKPEKASIRRNMKTSDWSGFRTMEKLAERTGGEAFYNNNDLANAFRRATDDARFSYVLGYYPSHHQWNGKFRRIKLRVKRHGVRLRYRRGYFAQPGEPTEKWYRHDVLGAAMWSPVDATQLGMTVRVIPSRAKPKLLNLELRLDPRDIELKPTATMREGKLDIWIIQLGKNDKLVGSGSQIANLRMIPAVYARVIQDRKLVLMEHIERQPKAVLLRVLVRDIATGALGSVSIPLNRVAPAPNA